MNAAQIGYSTTIRSDFSGMWYGRAAFEYSPTAWSAHDPELPCTSATHFRRDPGTKVYKVSNALGPKIVNSPKGADRTRTKTLWVTRST